MSHPFTARLVAEDAGPSRRPPTCVRGAGCRGGVGWAKRCVASARSMRRWVRLLGSNASAAARRGREKRLTAEADRRSQ